MKIETLTERIANAESKIAKKTATIAKKTAWISNKEKAMEKMTDENDKMWAGFDIKHWKEDIERNGKEIEELRKSLETYKKQLDGEMKREAEISELPENLKRMQSELVKKWDDYDTKRRDHLKEEYLRLGWEKFRRRYGASAYDEKDWSDEKIHDNNVHDAKTMVLNLIYRVRDKVGEITDWRNVRCTAGTWGCPVLNGWIEGTQGRCMVESIGAGGYNIQRYHIRVLVKEYI